MAYSELNGYLNDIQREKIAKIIPENIRDGVTVLGVTGTLEEGVDTSDATATANDIFAPKTAYVNGTKITGSIQTGYRSGDPSQYTTATVTSVAAGYYKNIKIMPDGNRLILNGTTLNIYDASMNLLNTYDIADYGITSCNYYTFDVCNTANTYGGRLVVLLGIKTGNLLVSCLYYKNGQIGVKLVNTQAVYKLYTGLSTNQGVSACVACYNSTADKFCILYRVATNYANGTFSKLSVSLTSDINITLDSSVGVIPDITYSLRDIYLSNDDAYLSVNARETYLAGMGGNTPHGFSGIISMSTNSAILSFNTICPPIFLSNGANQYVLFIDNLYSLSDNTATVIKTGVTEVQFSGVISSDGQRYNASTSGYKYGKAIGQFLILTSTAGVSKLFYINDLTTGSITSLGTLNYGNANICVFTNNQDVIHISSGVNGVDVVMPEDILFYIIYNNYRLNNESDATATAGNILSTKTAYVDGVKLTGTMPNNGTLTYTPTTSQQTIPAGYTSGGTIAAISDNNLIPGNIKKDVTILGVTGTYEGEALPYTELEYIESTGTQWINTEIAFNNYDINAKIMHVSKNNSEAMFGFYMDQNSSWSTKYALRFTKESDGKYHWWCPTIEDYTRTFTTTDNDFVVSYIGTSLTIKNFNDTTTYYSTTVSKSTSTPNSFYGYLFGEHVQSSGTAATDLSSMRLYSFKLSTTSGTAVRDFIPVKRTSDNEICLYDKVTETFFTNQGTGTFLAGPKKGE